MEAELSVDPMAYAAVGLGEEVPYPESLRLRAQGFLRELAGEDDSPTLDASAPKWVRDLWVSWPHEERPEQVFALLNIAAGAWHDRAYVQRDLEAMEAPGALPASPVFDPVKAAGRAFRAEMQVE